MKKIALFDFVIALTISAFQAEPSLANYICPNGPGPGEVQIGMTPGGNGVAALPVCEQSGGGGGQQGQGPQYHVSPLAGPTAVLQGEVARLEGIYRANQRKIDSITKDPFQLYAKSAWAYNHEKDACAAQFQSKKGLIEIAERFVANRFEKGTALSFAGARIPAPETDRKIQVTLEQAGQTPQILEATNLTIVPAPLIRTGVLIFMDLPMTRDRFETMPDNTDFRITFEGKEIFAMGWRDGLKARDKLRKQCETVSAALARSNMARSK